MIRTGILQVSGTWNSGWPAACSSPHPHTPIPAQPRHSHVVQVPMSKCWYGVYLLHCKKEYCVPALSRDVVNQTLPGRELLNYSRPERV